ncbi:hypothetical protein LWE61_09105 [Sphingobium sufflavum]|uniref:hypothetical protein n=1 Tax=Sphingobium sufflavum TaxID=1129547 RepID=UPI001F341DBC|nr:hypothetical protein [Sphingobium sufflavum]MCE7796717.1 hypothetical protein [Sphingobium sufflavum]
MRDSATIWVIDQGGELALPRVTFDGIGESWERPWLQLNFVHADGRTLRIWDQVPGNVACDDAGNAAIRGVGPLAIQCLEPFRRWTFAFDGIANQSTTAEERAGSRSDRTMPLSFAVEAQMAAPPWLMGGLSADAAARMQACDASALMGGVRYEQICRLTGTVSFDGRTYPIDATGMRVRRQGVRNMGAALGHCQHSALFPSGKAFGAIVMAPGPEGPDAFNEAFLLTADGRKIAARIVSAPWMTHLQDSGDDASLLLESEWGRVRIEGTTLLTMFDHHNFEMAATSILHQGTARYIWDGEETIGLIERCTLRDRLQGI